MHKENKSSRFLYVPTIVHNPESLHSNFGIDLWLPWDYYDKVVPELRINKERIIPRFQNLGKQLKRKDWAGIEICVDWDDKRGLYCFRDKDPFTASCIHLPEEEFYFENGNVHTYQLACAYLLILSEYAKTVALISDFPTDIDLSKKL